MYFNEKESFCGRQKTFYEVEVEIMSIINITSNNFQAEVLASDKPVLVDFYADWCGPCKMMSPILEQLATEVEGKAKIGKVNVDLSADLAQKYGVMSIPTLIVFKNGEISHQVVGARPKQELLSLLEI